MTAVALAAVPLRAQNDRDVGQVRETLKGPVIQILRKLVPDLSQVSPERAYDHTLANLGLLETCFKTFRERRDRFAHLLVDGSGKAVTSDKGLLACGHTLEIVVAMIVRTAAKRYFRHHVGLGEAPKFKETNRQGLLGKVRKALASQTSDGRTLAEELYDSIKAYLLFEWQVPLVPTYAKMTPAQVTSLGERLLQYTSEAGLARAAGLPVSPKAAAAERAAAQAATRNAEDRERSAAKTVRQPLPEIRQAKLAPGPRQDGAENRDVPAGQNRPLEAAPRPSPSPVPPRQGSLYAIPIQSPAQQSAARNSDPNGRKLTGASFASILALPQVQSAVAPALHGETGMRVIDLVGAKAWAALILTLGIRRKDQLAVLVLNAFCALGLHEFQRLFGTTADPDHLDGLIESATAQDISPDCSLDQVISFVVKTFTPRQPPQGF